MGAKGGVFGHKIRHATKTYENTMEKEQSPVNTPTVRLALVDALCETKESCPTQAPNSYWVVQIMR